MLAHGSHINFEWGKIVAEAEHKEEERAGKKPNKLQYNEQDNSYRAIGENKGYQGGGPKRKQMTREQYHEWMRSQGFTGRFQPVIVPGAKKDGQV